MRRLPPLSSLRAFEATARLNSVTRAAAELGRTHGAVSRQLRSLQEAAGVPLFDKAGTGLRLNPRGEALLRSVAGALDQLEQGWQPLLQAARGPAVHVACSATFAMRWLVPHLPGFYRAHPGLRLQLSMTSARELRHEGADLAIAWDRLSYPAADQARAIPLASVAFGPVCVPGYPVTGQSVLPGTGQSVPPGTGQTIPPGTGQTVLRMPVRIDHDFTARAWEAWQAASGRSVQAAGELRFPHTHLCLEAALAGLGVALVERRLVRDELAQGRLVAPCGFVPFAEGLAAVPLSERAASPAAQAFIAWLRGALAEAG